MKEFYEIQLNDKIEVVREKINNKLDITNLEKSGNLIWFSLNTTSEIFGIYGTVQLCFRDEQLVEINITPNWEKYKAENIYINTKSEEAGEQVKQACVTYMKELYGQPYKTKETAMAWKLDDKTKFKLSFEKCFGYNLNILIKAL